MCDLEPHWQFTSKVGYYVCGINGCILSEMHQGSCVFPETPQRRRASATPDEGPATLSSPPPVQHTASTATMAVTPENMAEEDSDGIEEEEDDEDEEMEGEQVVWQPAIDEETDEDGGIDEDENEEDEEESQDELEEESEEDLEEESEEQTAEVVVAGDLVSRRERASAWAWAAPCCRRRLAHLWCRDRPRSLSAVPRAGGSVRWAYRSGH